MRSQLTSSHGDSAFDPQLAVVVEATIQRMELGEAVDIDALAAAHPEFATQLRELLATAALLLRRGDVRTAIVTGRASAHRLAQPSYQQIGDFRIIRELGHGGMGTVFEAEQISMGRRVALKVLPFGALTHHKSLQRFRNEVRAAAALNHPHIVSVYSVGEERGVHFYAMQLIHGQTLGDVIGRMRQQRKSDVSRVSSETCSHAPSIDPPLAYPPSTWIDEEALLSTTRGWCAPKHFFRHAAQIGIQAAEALQHAHNLGILHRDIKPGNLMLDANGKLFVTDFGLARIEADAGITLTGDIVGTLRYMAPEQALAKRVAVDRRADVYSLGATLYELLTLQPAFGETDRLELLKQVAFEEPRAPRRVDKSIPEQLENVIVKAISKKPDERYQTAQEFADDLQRFLDHRPTLACRSTLGQHASRWCQREAKFIWTGLVCSVLMLAVGAAAAWQQMCVAQHEAEVSRRRLELAGTILDQLLFDASAQSLMQPRIGDHSDELAGRNDVYRYLLRAAGPYYEQIAREGALSGSSVERLHALLQTARVETALYRYKNALRFAIAAQESARKFVRANPSHALAQRYLAESLAIEANLYHDMNDYGRVIDRAPAAIRAMKKAALTFSGDYQFRCQLVTSIASQARSLAFKDRFADALIAIESALPEVESLAAQYPQNAQFRDFLAWLYQSRGELLVRDGRQSDALACFREERSLRERQYQEGVYRDLPWMLVSCADPTLRDESRAIALARGHDRPNIQGVAEYRRGNWAKAEKFLLQAEIEGDKYLKGPTRLVLSMVYCHLGKPEAAEILYRKTMRENPENPLETERYRREAEAALRDAGVEFPLK